MISGRTALWQLLLSEFDKPYVTQRSIKGQALADHLAEHALPDVEPLRTDFPDEEILFATEEEKVPEEAEWTLYFDGAMNGDGNGIGAVLISPEQTPLALKKKIPLHKQYGGVRCMHCRFKSSAKAFNQAIARCRGLIASYMPNQGRMEN